MTESSPSRTPQVSTPLVDTISAADLGAGTGAFNAWLLEVSGGYVDLDRIKSAAAVIPVVGNIMALVDALDHGRVKPGDLILLVGFGAGMTAASAVIRWGGNP